MAHVIIHVYRGQRSVLNKYTEPVTFSRMRAEKEPGKTRQPRARIANRGLAISPRPMWKPIDAIITFKVRRARACE